MSIKAKQREDKSFDKKVGIFEGTVLAINPDLEKLEEIYGGNINREKEPEYLDEAKKVKLGSEEDAEEIEVRALRVAVVMKDKKTEALLNAQFYLEDRDRISTKGKKQFINGRGTTTWAEDADNLPVWFTKNTSFRVAKVGEEELYNFVNKWSNFDFSDPTMEVDLEWKKLMKGDVKILQELVEQNAKRTVVGLATVKVKEKDGEEQTYQGVYTKDFMPSYAIKIFRTKKFTPEVIEALREQEAERKAGNRNIEKLKYYEQFVLQVTDNEYGVKDFYKLTELQDYNPEDNFAASDEVLSEDGSDY